MSEKKKLSKSAKFFLWLLIATIALVAIWFGICYAMFPPGNANLYSMRLSNQNELETVFGTDFLYSQTGDATHFSVGFIPPISKKDAKNIRYYEQATCAKWFDVLDGVSLSVRIDKNSVSSEPNTDFDTPVKIGDYDCYRNQTTNEYVCRFNFENNGYQVSAIISTEEARDKEQIFAVMFDYILLLSKPENVA